VGTGGPTSDAGSGASGADAGSISGGYDAGTPDFAHLRVGKAYDEGSYYMIHLKVEPMLDGLRSDKRFADIVRSVGHLP